jgi:5'-nucleotidase
MKKPLILVSNDDGITSVGIRVLVELMQQIGEVVVVAPDSPQSGMGHAVTIGNTIRLFETDVFKILSGVRAFKCSGTPADCIKISKRFALNNRTPDLVVSGINHGSNTSISVLYSGTMSAAIEAAMEGLPSIGFSLCDYNPNSDFSHIKDFVLNIARQVLKTGLPKGIALNVNFPANSKGPIKGIKICRQAKAKWEEEFDQRTDPNGLRYFWLTGSFVNHDKGEDHDEWAIANNYVSVVPCQFDLTAHHAISLLNQEWDIIDDGSVELSNSHITGKNSTT